MEVVSKCYCNMFRGVRLIHFQIQINKLCTGCKIQFIEQRVLCYVAATFWYTFCDLAVKMYVLRPEDGSLWIETIYCNPVLIR